jgi:hypothetical protein
MKVTMQATQVDAKVLVGWFSRGPKGVSDMSCTPSMDGVHQNIELEVKKYTDYLGTFLPTLATSVEFHCSDSTTTETWQHVCFADDESGNGLSKKSKGKNYIGLCITNRSTQPKPSSKKWKWTPLKVDLFGDDAFSSKKLTSEILAVTDATTNFVKSYEELERENKKEFKKILRAQKACAKHMVGTIDNNSFKEWIKNKTKECVEGLTETQKACAKHIDDINEGAALDLSERRHGIKPNYFFATGNPNPIKCGGRRFFVIQTPDTSVEFDGFMVKKGKDTVYTSVDKSAFHSYCTADVKSTLEESAIKGNIANYVLELNAIQEKFQTAIDKDLAAKKQAKDKIASAERMNSLRDRTSISTHAQLLNLARSKAPDHDHTGNGWTISKNSVGRYFIEGRKDIFAFGQVSFPIETARIICDDLNSGKLKF